MAEAAAPVAAPHQTVARASGRDWLSVPVLTPTITTEVATTIDPQSFAASIAVARPMVHTFEPRHRSGDGPSGAMVATPADVHRLSTPSSLEVMHGPKDLPRMPLRRAPIADTPPPSYDPTPIDLIPAPTRAPAPEIEDEPVSSGVEEVDEPPARSRRNRPNLGQSRRLGLGTPVERLPEDVIPHDVRSEIHDAYGVDVSDVVIRRDEEAARQARDAAAAAFARAGEEVVLPADLGPLDHPDARGALAHELTHIAQQRLHGTGLPDEDSDAGRALEAVARAAEQRFRGDANAPSLEQSMRDEVQQWLSTGVAKQDDAGNLVFLPRSAGPGGVQRLPSATATPDYRWQEAFFLEHHGDDMIDRGLLQWGGADEQAIRRAEEAREQRFLYPELIPFREEKRAQLATDTEGAADRTAFRQIRREPAAETLPGAETEANDDAQIQQLQGDIRGLRQQLTEAEQRTQAERAEVEKHNRAVDEVDRQYPLRNFSADTEAVYREDPDATAVERLRTDLQTRQQTLAHRREELHLPAAGGELVHRTPTTGGGGTGTTTEPSSTTASSSTAAPSSTGVAPATTPTTTTPTPGAGTTPGHTPGGAAAAAALNFSWEAGVFSGLDLDLPLESALADFWGNETDQQTADRHRNEELALEQEHLPEMIRRRDARFAEIVEQAVDGKLRTYMAHGDPLPEGSPQAVLDLEDWQAAVEQVEREMPLHDFRAHNVLEASGFASLAAAAPTHAERTTQLEAARTERRNQARGTPGGAAAGAAAGGAAGGAAGAAAGGAPGGGAAGAAAGAASGGAAGAAGGAAAGAPAEAPVGATAAPAAEAAPVAAPVAEVPAAPAAAPAGHTGALEHIAEGGLVAALASGITSHAAGGHEMSPIDPVEIEFRPEMLERLVSELYPRLRSRLRTELLVDRERAGLLMDFR